MPENNFWKDQRVTVTGGAGFLGSFIVERLAAKGAREIIVPRSAEFNLTHEDAVKRLYESARPDMVIHLAATVGGIGANRENPGRFFYENMAMGLNLIEQARQFQIPKFVCLGTICAYPKFTPVPFREEELWNGYPEETNAPYGIAKKALLVMLQAYRQQYGMRGIYLLPVNLFGPRDNFDPQSSHVIPALIRKCVEAKKAGLGEIEVWGSGLATREFLYVEDAAEGVLLAAEKYDGEEPVNLGIGFEVTIRDLVGMIAQECGFTGDIRWNKDKPDGQPRRMLDVSRAESLFGFRATTRLEDGLRKTVQWYLEQS